MIHTKIMIIAPKQGVLVHSGMDVYDKESVKKIEAFIKNKLPEYGELERIILSMGTVRIMEPNEPIPVPLQPGRGLVIPAGGVLY